MIKTILSFPKTCSIQGLLDSIQASNQDAYSTSFANVAEWGQNHVLVFYNRPDTAGPKLSSYRKAELNSEQSGSLKEVLLDSLGYKGSVKKLRTLYWIGQTRVHVDEVENLGHFMEFEVTLDEGQTAEDGTKIAEKLMLKFDIKKEDLMDKAYLDFM